jgi:hypothetical protein
MFFLTLLNAHQIPTLPDPMFTPPSLQVMRLLNNTALSYGVTSLPHDKGSKPTWPSQSTLDLVRAIGAAPTCLILGAGEFLHINKSRLHAFRKLGGEASVNHGACYSVAWDWAFEVCSFAHFFVRYWRLVIRGHLHPCC